MKWITKTKRAVLLNKKSTWFAWYPIKLDYTQWDGTHERNYWVWLKRVVRVYTDKKKSNSNVYYWNV